MSVLKALGYVLLALVLTGAGLFAAAPAILDWLVPRYLASEGIDSTFQFARPGFSGLTIRSARVETATLQMRANNVVVRYSPHSLMAGRLTDVGVDTLRIDIEAADNEDTALAIPSPWNLLPVDRFRVAALHVQVPQPTATISGDLDLDASRARAHLLITSPILPASLKASLQLDPIGGIDVALAQSNEPMAVRLRGVPDDNTIFVDGRIDLTDETFELLANLILSGEPVGYLRGYMQASLPWPLALPLDLDKVTTSGVFDLDVSASLPPIEPVELAGHVSASMGSGRLQLASDRLIVSAGSFVAGGHRYRSGEGSRLDVDFDAGIPIDSLDANFLSNLDANVRSRMDLSLSSETDETPLRQVTVNGRMTTMLSKGEGLIRIGEETAVELKLPDYEAGLVSDAPFEMRWDIKSGNIRAADASIRMRLPEMNWLDQRIDLRDAHAEISRVKTDGNELAMAGRVRTNRRQEAVWINLVATASLQDRTGRFEMSTSHELSRPLLKSELPGWQSNYDVDRGTIEFSLPGDFRFTGTGVDLGGEGRLRLNDARVHYDDLVAKRVSATLPILIDKDDWRIGPGGVNMAVIDAGLALTDIRFDLQTDGIELELIDASARVLGGEIRFDRAAYDIKTSASQFDVAVAEVSVAEMLALVSEEVGGSGRLYGTLPVTLGPPGLHITDGALTARPPGGYINYRGPVPDTNPGLQLAFRALRDFNYDYMDVGVDYMPDGKLDLTVRLQGRNPDVQDGRAIHFNLNISQNLPALMQSLRASEEMSERIQQRLRKDK